MFPKHISILIVDKQMSMRKLTKKTLRELGYSQITECKTSTQAWELLKEAEGNQTFYDLVLCDGMMPQINGIELLKKIRQSGTPLNATPFLMLTTESDESNVVEALENGLNAYVLKPFTTPQLEAKLSAIWAKRPKKVA